jgi:hypothetical protein
MIDNLFCGCPFKSRIAARKNGRTIEGSRPKQGIKIGMLMSALGQKQTLVVVCYTRQRSSLSSNLLG